MARIFDRNMFIMLLAIMVGVIIITFFIADIQSKTRIEEIQFLHEEELIDIHAQNENFTDNFLQGTLTLDSAREIREVANYHFDFALFWYQYTVTTNASINKTKECIENATEAISYYQQAYNKFETCRPYFITAQDYTNNTKYLEVLRYYDSFADAGQNITRIRYNSTRILISAAENFSQGNLGNASSLFENMTMMEAMYGEAVGGYEFYQDQIDNYIFFSEIREDYREE